jgi:hypothetical protein
MSKLRYGTAEPKDSPKFDAFTADFFDAMTNVQDPGNPDGTLADLTAKVTALLNAMREQGMIQ